MNHQSNSLFLLDKMKLRTKLSLPPAAKSIGHLDAIVMIGSCFSVNISKRLASLKYSVSANPFGIVFNPISISQQLIDLISHRRFKPVDLFEQNGVWHSFSHHSSFDSLHAEDMLAHINTSIEEGHQQLCKAKFLFITFGTSYYFELQKSGTVVANCHKTPSSEFTKKRAELNELIGHFSASLLALKDFNPDIQVVFSVSPVRHIKDGIVENSQSKAILNNLCHSLIEKFNFCSYFPAYEIMVDDLRDYRFYESDLIHPNEMAIEYIWDKFGHVYFNEPTRRLNAKILNVLLAAEHRPFHLKSENHQKFIKKQLEVIKELETLSGLNFEEEKSQFESQIAS